LECRFLLINRTFFDFVVAGSVSEWTNFKFLASVQVLFTLGRAEWNVYNHFVEILGPIPDVKAAAPMLEAIKTVVTRRDIRGCAGSSKKSSRGWDVVPNTKPDAHAEKSERRAQRVRR